MHCAGSDTYNLSLYRHNNIIVPQNNIYIQYNDNRQYKDNRSSVNWKTVATTVFICTALYLVFSSRHEIAEVIFETVLPAIASLPRLAWSCVIWVYCGISGGIGLGLRAFVAGCSFGWTCLIVSVSYVWQGSIWACLAIRNLSSIVCTSAWTAGQYIWSCLLSVSLFMYTRLSWGLARAFSGSARALYGTWWLFCTIGTGLRSVGASLYHMLSWGLVRLCSYFILALAGIWRLLSATGVGLWATAAWTYQMLSHGIQYACYGLIQWLSITKGTFGALTTWIYHAVSRAIWHTWQGIWYIGFGLTVGYFASRFLVSGS
jgi:hypothetical protein